jgi:sigma-B regulation protein RsbU (phosphoserine phosphatase)
MEATNARYSEFAEAVLRLAYSFIDPYDMVWCLENNEKTELYNNTQIVFNTIKDMQRITFLYFFTVQDDTMVYYINAAASWEYEQLQEGQKIVTLNSRDPLPPELYDKVANPGEGIRIIHNESDYGHMMGAYYAVRNSSGEIIGILASEVNMYGINATIREYLFNIVTGSIIIMIICAFLIIFYMQKKVTLPIKNLSESANNFVNHAPGEELQPIISIIKTHDEIETLSDSIEKMTADMITYIKNLTAVTAEKERIGAELTVATQIQASMLPHNFPNRGEFELFATMQPAKEVGGDFYDFFYINDDTLAVVMADVSGKGVPAALFMVIAKTLIKTNALRGLSPKEVFEVSNNLLCENNEADMFVTAFMGYLDIPGGKFTFVNAGHNPPLLKHGGQFDWLKTKVGFVLAGMEGMSFTEEEIILETGDELFLYTDGVTEAHDIEDNLFSDPYLLEVANKCKYKTPDEFNYYIKAEIDAFAGEAPQADDITMLLLKYKGV